MATFKMVGLDEYIKKLTEMRGDAEDEIKRSVYVGAGIVAGEIVDSIRANLPTHPYGQYGTAKDPIVGVTKKEKSDLIESFGLAPMRNDGGFINTKAGFDGYGSIRSKAYPKGVPNSTLMRSVESGSSFRTKTPVIRQAVERAREKAVKAMQFEFEKQINEIM